MVKAFKKTIRIGTVDVGWRTPVDLFCRIECTAGDKGACLSICGVEGPQPNGDAYGSCGQIIGLPWPLVDYAPGWDAATVERFRATWDRWNLNDMRAGCEHQRAAQWGAVRIEVVTYGLTHDAMRLRDAALKEATRAGLRNEAAELTPTARALAEMSDWYADRYAPPSADSPLSGCYEIKKRETKSASRVKPSEHPQGVLCKPCPTCGYKYGAAWLHEAVPTDVLEFLRGLPDADTQPAWV